MLLRDLIIELQALADEHGDMFEVRINHEEADNPEYVPECDGCPEYISLVSA